MNLTFVCDDLVQRDPTTDLLDLLCDQFPQAPIATLAHSEGKILGPIEQRPIHSTFLSHKISDRRQMAKYLGTVPAAAKTISWPTPMEKVVVLSAGLGHAIPLPDDGKSTCYLLQWDLDLKQSWWQKLFSAHVEKWRRQALQDIDQFYVSSNTLGQWLGQQGIDESKISVLYPPFNLQEFVPHPSKDLSWDYYLVDVEHLAPDSLLELIEVFRKLNTQVKFVGRDDQFEGLKEDTNTIEFWGWRCAGELVPLINNARAIIHLDERAYPYLAIGALACGRPLISKDVPINQELFGQKSGLFVNEIEQLANAIKEMDLLYADFDREKLRMAAYKFSTTKFVDTLKNEVRS